MSSNVHVFSTTRFAFSRQTKNVYKNVNKKIEKGVAFPTCISVNSIVCHFSLLDNDEAVLESDILIIHIDGFISAVTHTHVLQEGPITGRPENVIAAANTATEVALRLVRPGKKFRLTYWVRYSHKHFRLLVELPWLPPDNARKAIWEHRPGGKCLLILSVLRGTTLKENCVMES